MNQRLFKAAALFMFLAFLLPSLAVADFHRLVWTPAPGAGNETAGRAVYFDVLYIEETNNLKFYVVFDPKAGVLPNGFQLAINNGPNPNGKPGELAFFYFDATNPAEPLLSVYAYNGINMDSWLDGSDQAGLQDPDLILSSYANLGSPVNPAGWVKELKYFNDGSKAIFLMSVDVSLINAHSPLYPNASPWSGAKFDSKLGMWFHPVSGLDAFYKADGSLLLWARRAVGWYDTANQLTGKAGPVCEGKIKSPVPPVPVEIGKSFFTSVIGEGYGQILNPDVYTVTYANVPSGAIFTIPEGVAQTLPVGGGIETEFYWTPGPEHAGKQFDIDVTFTSQDGLSVSCPFALVVNDNEPPVCDSGAATGLYRNLSCSDVVTSVQLDGSKSTDPDNTAAVGGSFSYSWTTDCPGGVLDNNSIATPTLTFNSENRDGTPVSCNAYLTISDGFKSSSCEAAVSVDSCTKDCNSVINGTAAFDICGVCGGDGTSCLDCAGAAFGAAVADRCGVCQGDGMSCLDCSEIDIKGIQVGLDSNAALQKNLVKKALRVYKRLANTESSKRFSVKKQKEAALLNEQSWLAVWELPQSYSLCSNEIFCKASNDNESAISSYVGSSEKLKALVDVVAKRIQKLGGAKQAAKLRSKADKLHNENLSGLKGIPSGSSRCS